jgi:hypothetical protein
MNRTTKIGIGAALVGGLVILPAAGAFAHHNTITAVAVCNTTTGLFDLLWSVENSEGISETITISSNGAVVPVGTEVLPHAVPTFAQNGVVAGTYELVLDSKWTNNQTAHNSGSVTAEGPCEAPTPTPTPTPTPDPTVTPVPTPEPTVPPVIHHKPELAATNGFTSENGFFGLALYVVAMIAGFSLVVFGRKGNVTT